MEHKYSRYSVNSTAFKPIGETIDKLPSGFYEPMLNTMNGEIYFEKREVVMPNLYILPNDIQGLILEDIYKFWGSEERYRKFGNVYKRNILLYSQPGNGKTCLINLIASKLINEYDGVVVYINNIYRLKDYCEIMPRFRQIEPNRKVVCVIEDFEKLAMKDDSCALLLQLLDGNAQIDNVVTIATTNYPQELEKRFVCRPSRFNLVIEYKKPSDDARRAYISEKLKDGGIDITDQGVKKDIERYVGKTKNYTFDFVKEAIQSMYIDGISEDDTFKRLDDIIKKNGKYKVDEESPSGIGFKCESGPINERNKRVSVVEDYPQTRRLPREQDESQYNDRPNTLDKAISKPSERLL